ncbi:hypothetical protein LCGC14_0864370 [marine sediment metagenome]|uniref:site-specific DNA-methyltransferase (adenine-specific) n=1 Tax=marine sediment metagenome TaxID=412755 RepID=A0A0F9P6G6_9ZZZZ
MINKNSTEKKRINLSMSWDTLDNSTKDYFREEIRKLIEKYEKVVKDNRKGEFMEEDVKVKFLNPLLEAMGWNVRGLDEVKFEQRTLTGRTDFGLRISKYAKPVIFYEAKSFIEHLDNKRKRRGKDMTYAEIAIEDAWQMKVGWCILTNFEKFRLYFTHVRTAKEGLVYEIKYQDYLKEVNLERLWDLSKHRIENKSLYSYELKRTREDINTEVVNDLLIIREKLLKEIRSKNKLSNEELKVSIQRILDRLVIIRTAEDRGVIKFDSLNNTLSHWKDYVINQERKPFTSSLKELYRDFESVYNSKLFKKHSCEDLIIGNNILKSIILILYKYNFDLIDADILGAIYEDYLGHILEVDKNDEIGIVESRAKRKKRGIYYTPSHIVDYIVRKLFTLFFVKEPVEKVTKIRILDSACGSGSFLIKAYDILKEYYELFNKQIKRGTEKGKGIVGFSKIIPNIEKRILIDNLYGVDLDSQAVEIAVMNLILKALKKGEQLPPLLGNNIKWGNSLIKEDREELIRFYGENYSYVNAFDWDEKFPKIVRENKGFDIIIGNPPHGAKLSKEDRKFFKKNYHLTKGMINSAILFIEKSYNLLKDDGLLGLVIPKSLTFSQKWNPTRIFILKNFRILEIVDISEAFKGVLLEQILLICKKEKSSRNDYIGKSIEVFDKSKEFLIPLYLTKELDIFPVHIDTMSLRIYEKMLKCSLKLKEISQTFRGLPLQSKAVRVKTDSHIPLLKGADIRPFFNREASIFVDKKFLSKYKNKTEKMESSKIISQRIVAHVLKPKDHIIIMSNYDDEGLLSVDTVENTILTSSEYSLFYLLAFLNSKLISWYVYYFIFNRAVRTMDFDDYYIGKIPLFKASKIDQEPIIKLVQDLSKETKLLKENRVKFIEEVNKIPRLDDRSLNYYYTKLNSKDKKVIIKSNLQGNIKNLTMLEDGTWLKLKIDYEIRTDKRKEQFNDVVALKINLIDKSLRSFLNHSIVTAKIKSKKGFILRNLLKIPIPLFEKNDGENSIIIKELMKNFLESLERQKILEQKIKSLEDQINSKVYRFYNLIDEEIQYIESNFGLDSAIIKLLLKD